MKIILKTPMNKLFLLPSTKELLATAIDSYLRFALDINHKEEGREEPDFAFIEAVLIDPGYFPEIENNTIKLLENALTLAKVNFIGNEHRSFLIPFRAKLMDDKIENLSISDTESEIIATVLDYFLQYVNDFGGEALDDYVNENEI
jgi:hypothetical protein